MFAAFQGFVSPESFSLMESIAIVAMVVCWAASGTRRHFGAPSAGRVMPGGAAPCGRPLQAMTDGWLDCPSCANR
jgi:branched-chain amino acid transport system permease protein